MAIHVPSFATGRGRSDPHCRSYSATTFSAIEPRYAGHVLCEHDAAVAAKSRTIEMIAICFFILVDIMFYYVFCCCCFRFAVVVFDFRRPSKNCLQFPFCVFCEKKIRVIRAIRVQKKSAFSALKNIRVIRLRCRSEDVPTSLSSVFSHNFAFSHFFAINK